MKNVKSIIEEYFEVSSGDFDRAQFYQQKHGGKLELILLNMGVLSEEQLAQLYALQFDLDLFDEDTSSGYEIVPLHDIAQKFLVERNWFLLSKSETHWILTTSEPLNLEVNNFLAEHNIEFSLTIATEAQIQALSAKITPLSDEFEGLNSLEEEKLKELASEAPTVNYLNSLMARALKSGSSDMHIEPTLGRYRVRLRIDGVLHEIEKVPQALQMPIITRLKILSGMDIAEKRRPQDGKIETRIANKEIDIRVSALPLAEGESIVMRFLKKESVQYDLSVIQLSPDIERAIRKDIKKTAGVVLLTGPTGSGKTTTLYTFLNALNNEDVKIITLEDPVEYQLPGVNQVQVNSEIGFDFAAGLRSIVRQDPDVIMVGEIRDKETAQIALQSALTGHLVFSTVHTNDAPSAFTRLLDLGVDEFLLNAALVSIVAQRLARKVCEHCAVPEENSSELINEYNLENLKAKFGLKEVNLRRGCGCELCGNTGFKGRMAITEYLPIDDTIKLIPKNETFILNARKYAEESGRRNLMEDGLYKAIQGLTTIDEVLRVAG
ncbi:GspE/PulE family protein [Pseudoalteromonas xiamenensis]